MKESLEWVVDRFGEIKILRYEVPGFESLPTETKKLLYYLSQAALCGRDILFDQNFRHNLSIRRTLETIFLDYRGDRNTEEFARFTEYLKKVWFANGIHHHYSTDKFVPGFSGAYFDTLTAHTPALKGKEELLRLLKPILFDPALFAKRVCSDPRADLVECSSNNYYRDVTQEEAGAFYAAKQAETGEGATVGLNSRLEKREGTIREAVWYSHGTYAASIRQIVYWLERAAATTENLRQKKIIELLIRFYETGSLEVFDRYSIEWVQETGCSVDFVNGFIEVYGDPLGFKGAWESIVNIKDPVATERTEIISRSAAWFEAHSPIDNVFKKSEVKGISAKVINAVMLGGDCYPATPIGINLPNSDAIRKAYGSKSVSIQNITDAYKMAALKSGFDQEFILREKDRERIRTYGTLAGNLHTDLHECLGHGSGQLAEGVRGDELKNYASPLEEARADLFALYFLGDPKLIELGLIPSFEVTECAYLTYLQNGLIGQLARIEPGKQVVQAHMRCRKLISAWALERAAALRHGNENPAAEMVEKEGKHYIVVNDRERLREIFGQLLREVQRIKSEGDYDEGRLLVERYGVKIDPALHREVLERYSALDEAPYSGFVNPVLQPVRDESGEIIDVKISYNESYTEQMLRYSEEYSFEPLDVG